MKGLAHFVAIAAISILAVATAAAQDPAAPAQPAAAAPAGVAASGSVPSTTAPNVARVSATNGRTMLNRASVYQVAKLDMRLQAGDRLVVLENESITIQFDNGCLVTIDSAQVYTVPDAAPCAPGAAERGVRAPTPVSGTGALPTATSNAYLKWGLVALGIATPLLLLSDSTQGSPISP